MVALKVKNKITPILITVCLTTILMLSKQNLNLTGEKIYKFTNKIIRNLFENSKINELCKDAGILKKYKKTDNCKNIKNPKLSKYQQKIVDLIRDEDFGGFIKDYLKRIAIFIAYLVLVIVFIGFWISYCVCCCCPCCCYKPKTPDYPLCKKIVALIALICIGLAIIFIIVGFAHVKSFKKKSYGVGCSAMKLVKHFINGLNGDFPGYSFNGLSDIKKELNNLDTIYQDAKDSVPSDPCLNNNADTIKDIQEIIGNNNVDDEQGNIKDIEEKLSDVEGDYFQDIYDFLKDSFYKYLSILLYSFFGVMLFLAVLSIVFICLYYLFPICIWKVFYVIVWNFTMIFIIVIMLVSVLFGVVSYIAKDGVNVAKYIKSEKNLNSNDPIVIKHDDTTTSELINKCFNGDGKIVYKNADITDDELNEYTSRMTDIIECEKNKGSNDVEILEAQKKYLDTLTYFKNRDVCTYVNCDVNIILDEIDSLATKAIIISTMGLLVSIFMGFSVMFGIMAFNKLKKEDDPDKKLESGETTYSDVNATSATEKDINDKK